MIKVSVVVPIYNVEAYLEECLEHIRLQTLTDIEVIMVNDGTKDNSVEIAEKYVHMDSRFTLISQENQGLSMARNNGAKYAKGKYIHFCDSDDYLAEHALELLYQMAEEKDADIIEMSVVRFNDGEPIPDEAVQKVNVLTSKLVNCYEHLKSGKELMNELLKTSIIPQAQFMFINRAFYENSGVQFFPGILHEDNLFFFQIYWEAKRVFWSSERLYYFRKRQGSITATTHNKKSFEGYSLNFRKMWEQCKENPEVIQQYPDILNYVKFSFAQALRYYKKMNFQEKRDCTQLTKKIANDAKEVPLKKTLSTYLFIYLPYLLR